MAVQHYIDGSLLEVKGDYAGAILEYQDALRFSHSPAIYYALSKDYSALGKHALAIEAGREAIRQAPAKLDYRRLLAEVYLSAFQPDSAAAQYEEIIHQDSSDLQSWFNLGRIYESRRPLRALTVYETMLQRFGPEWPVLLRLADLYNKQGQYEKAADALRQMKDLDPGNQPLQRTLAQTYTRAGKYGEAEKILENLREIDPSNLDYAGDLGGVYLLQKEYSKAEAAFAPILQSDTVSTDAKIKVGQLYYDQVEKDSTLLVPTREIFQRIQAASPKDWRAYWFLGALASLSHDDSTAIHHFRKVTELAPWNPDGWVFLSSAYFGKNDFASMAEVLEDGRKHVPDDFRVNFYLGVAYNRLGQLEEAAHILERAHQINPQDIEAISELAMVYDGLKRHEESDSLYELGLRLKPEYDLILNNYAYSLAERGVQLNRALQMATRAVDAQPGNASYLDTKGWVYYQLGKYQEAEKYVKEAIGKGNANSTLYEHLGDIAFRLQDRQQAIENWKKALELDQKNADLRAKLTRGSL
jgi:tetratricopeptide (TPR) repeat protein